MDDISSSPHDDRSVRHRLASLRLRFPDPELESAYRADRYTLNLGNIRFSFLAGIALWVAWGILLRPHMLALSDQRLDMAIRYGVFIPMLVGGLALSFTSLFRRIWEWVSVVIAVVTIVVWVYYTSNVLTLPAEYGYIGVILITAFTYTLLRLRFILVVLITMVGIAAYLPYAFTARYIVDVSRVLATLYLISFGILGGLAAYRMERFTRQLFIRERQLDRERERSDVLLLNILPPAVIEQLKASSGERVAEAFEEVSVVFVDAVGSTAQAARSSPSEFAGALDALFRRFDEKADRLGLEKIKTIGRRVHGRRGRTRARARPRGFRGRDGPRDPCRLRDGPVAVGRPDRRAGRGRHRPRRRRGHRGAEVRVRRVGRHREPREQARGARRARRDPGLRADGERGHGSVRVRAGPHPGHQRQGANTGPCLARPRGVARGT